MTALSLRKYQHLIVEYILSHKRCNLFVAMGLGKTVSTLTAIDILSMAEEVYPVLVLAPLRVAKTTWPDEVLKWPHLQHINVMPVIGTDTERRNALATDAQIYCMNYENLEWLCSLYGDKWPFKTVVADECSKLKGFRLRQGTKRSQALGGVAHTKVNRFIGLTGTPCANGIKDVWSITWFLDRGERLGRSFSSFSNRWFRPARNGFGIEPLAHAQAEIQDRIKDICLTLDAKDWFDLKEPIVNTIYVDLPMKARKHYAEMEKAMFTEIAGHEVEAFGAAARTNKCLQIANGAAYVGGTNEAWEELHDAKIQALESIVEEAAGAPVLCAYHFKSDLARLKKAFPKARVLDSKPQTITDWNAGKIPLLFAHPASAGHGLNLQHGGNILVYFAHTWNLEERQQILERIGPVRQQQAGYDRPVFVHLIVARDTVDELVIARVDEKRSVQEILLEAMKTRK